MEKEKISLGRHPLRKRGRKDHPSIKSTNIDGKIHNENTKRLGQVQNIKVRCEKSGIPFDISHRDFDWPTHCPILGIELVRGTLSSDKNSSPSIDRINPELGYTKGNVRVISFLANKMKQNATRNQIEMFCKNIFPYLDGES